VNRRRQLFQQAAQVVFVTDWCATEMAGRRLIS